MAKKRDYYEILGVARNAPEAEIKKAFRRLAMKFHPDRNQSGDGDERFKEVKEAYEVLSDQHKRAAYDQFGHAGVDSASAAGRSGFGAGAGFGDVFGDIFGDIFGGGRRGGQRRTRGADLRFNLELSLEEAVRGTETRIRVPTLVRCETCEGSGAKAGSRPATCRTCEGHGQVRMQQGFFSIQQTCPNCRGRGQVITDPCRDCQGQGRVQNTRTLSVRVPAGVDDGDQIRLAGEGEAGERGSSPGDLYVQIHLQPHAIFTRDGNDLYCEMPVSFTTLAVGGEIEIPTLEGKVRMRVPPETQTERLFRLRGKGVRNVRSGELGDLFCKITVETPVNLTRRQRELLEEFEESLRDGGERHNPRARTWTDKLKGFFDGLVT